MRLEFVSRGTRMDTETAERMGWRSRCGRYLVLRSVSKFGLPTTIYAIKIDDRGQQELLSKACRSKEGAMAVCQNDADGVDADVAKPDKKPRAKRREVRR